MVWETCCELLLPDSGDKLGSCWFRGVLSGRDFSSAEFWADCGCCCCWLLLNRFRAFCAWPLQCRKRTSLCSDVRSQAAECRVARTFWRSASCTSGTRTGALLCLAQRQHEIHRLRRAIEHTRSLMSLDMLQFGELAVAQAALFQGHMRYLGAGRSVWRAGDSLGRRESMARRV